MVLVGKGAMIFQWNGPAAFLHAMVDMWIFQKNTCLILRSAEANEFARLIVLVEVIVLVEQN